MIGSLIVISIVILFINLIVNYKKIEEKIEKIDIKIKQRVILVFEVIMMVFCLVMLVNKSKECLELLTINKEIDADIKKIDEYQKKEAQYYNEAMEKQYENQNYDEPYMPKGFSYVEGTWDTGYVIQDEKENQYVWVPCTNLSITGVTKLARRNFVYDAYMSKDLCYDLNCEDFIISALQNGGFYIARFEIGQEENDIPVSKKNAKIWNNINKEEALEKINIIDQQNKEIRVELMNSYAYDTAFEWIRNTNVSEEIKYEVIVSGENGERYAGTKSYNNIYDLFDTTYEMTTEIYSGNDVISRGPSGIVGEDIGKKENRTRMDNRISKLFEKSDDLGFRTILYR